ncbi:hypothetical protein [Swingsia samuiensis]|uniref:Uncharacterized protein n=1 Tax=Swingsia samuiensis TaxID=1293412 RepID=A0A4Y6UHR4_9PROT|nr:hypothetical protein [Swingsia samuiensis]QDH17139.1 hypothetical protein E3D00_05845 [Swingsia samuiensis]
MRKGLIFAIGMLVIAGRAFAQDAGGGDGDDAKKPNMHELFRNSAVPKSHADFSRFKYRPIGDTVIEQPDAFRLLFRTPDGQPDGYAERRGMSVFYYDRHGNMTHIQPLPEDAFSSPQ